MAAISFDPLQLFKEENARLISLNKIFDARRKHIGHTSHDQTLIHQDLRDTLIDFMNSNTVVYSILYTYSIYTVRVHVVWQASF